MGRLQPRRAYLTERKFFRLQMKLYAILAFLMIALVANSQVARTAAAAEPIRQVWQETPQTEITDSQINLFLPQVMSAQRATSDDDRGERYRPTTETCPTDSAATFDSVPVVGSPTDLPPEVHADLNLAVRGYTTVDQLLALVDIDGQADPDAPQLATVTNAADIPHFIGTYQVNDWNWTCPEDSDEIRADHGCRADPITNPPVTLLAIQTQQGVPIQTPLRHAEIYAGGYVALVLYAEEERLTLVYTREDTAAFGYAIHLEGFCVDASLLTLYRNLNEAGRVELPALHSLEQVGTTSQRSVKVAVRDTGSFLDPRSRKDWWKQY